MRHLYLLLTALFFTLGLHAQEDGLLMHFDFTGVSGTSVPDQSSSGLQATLVNGATVETMGKYQVLNLGSSNGYLDLSAQAGEVLKAHDNYSVSVYYYLDEGTSLSGNGYFLWSFSTSNDCQQSTGKYTAYRLNAQRFATSTGGYSNETGIETGSQSATGRWINVVYTQQSDTGRLYVEGTQVGMTTSMPLNSTNFGSETVQYNWLGRSAFTSDAYLSDALIYDFRVYDHALSASDVAQLNKVSSDLDDQYLHGTPGDASELSAAISEAEELIASSDGYLEGAIEDLKDYVTYEKSVVSGGYSQKYLDKQTAALQSAIEVVKSSVGLTFSQISNLRSAYDTSRGFIHPGGMYTQADFDRVKQQLADGNATVTAAYNVLKESPYSQSDVTTYPVETIIRGISGQDNYINAARGAAMAFQNALRWRIEGDDAFAANGVKILMSWANTCKSVSGNSNWALASGLYGYEFAQAAELLRDYSGWAKDDFDTFKAWMIDVWYEGNINFLRGRNGTWENWVGNQGGIRPGHYWSNWPLCNALSCISIGILCDDVFIYNQGMSFMKYDQVGTFEDPRTADPILNDGCTEFIGNLVVTKSESDLETGAYGELGQMQESGRDGGHAAMALGLAVDIAHTAWNQGDDLFSYMDNRLAAGIEFVAACTQSVTGLPWTNYKYVDCRTAWHNGWTMTGPAEPAEVRSYWGTVIGHYEGVKGVKMPYSEQALSAMGTDSYYTAGSSGGYDHLGFSVLMNTRDSIASADEVPTLLTPKMIYDGDTIAHNELGGLKNTYIVDTNKALPTGKMVTLMPQLPDGEENTGLWKWNTGETTQNITVSTDQSYVYRVTYTNKNGVESQQDFTLAVDGDCMPARSVSISASQNGETLGSDTVTVYYGTTLTLTATASNGWGSFLWDNGQTGSSITTAPVVRERDYSVNLINQGGARTYGTIHVKVQKMSIQTEVNGVVKPDTTHVIVNFGDEVVLGPYVPAFVPDVTYSWSNGSTERTVTIESASTTESYTQQVTIDGETTTIEYEVVVADSVDADITPGIYFIKNIDDDTYLTNNGTLRATFAAQTGDTLNLAQVWNVQYAKLYGYTFESRSDHKYLNLATRMSTTASSRCWAFRQAVGTDRYTIHNYGGYYWSLEDGSINISTYKQPVAFNIQLVPCSDSTGISEINADDASDSEEPAYNVAGQRVNDNYKGVIIQNGHKKIRR